jgi:dephospho-CoA kinase
MMIIGLTGYSCSGKDTIAEYIVRRHGYKHYSLSDVIRKIMKERNIEFTRENMITLGIKLRREYGNNVLAKRILEKTNLNGKYCITSIRHSDEVRELKKKTFFNKCLCLPTGPLKKNVEEGKSWGSKNFD